MIILKNTKELQEFKLIRGSIGTSKISLELQNKTVEIKKKR